MVGVGRGAHAGVLIKNAEALERMQRIDALVVDESGTLTEGKPKVVAVKPAAGYSDPEVLLLAASVERASEHPLADARSCCLFRYGLMLPSAPDCWLGRLPMWHSRWQARKPTSAAVLGKHYEVFGSAPMIECGPLRRSRAFADASEGALRRRGCSTAQRARRLCSRADFISDLRERHAGTQGRLFGRRNRKPTPSSPSNKNSMPCFSSALRSFSTMRSDRGSSEFSRRITVRLAMPASLANVSCERPIHARAARIWKMLTKIWHFW